MNDLALMVRTILTAPFPPAECKWPDWSDAGRRVEIQTEVGVVVGTLRANDMGFDGESEYPIFAVEDESGTEHSFASAVRWRYLPFP